MKPLLYNGVLNKASKIAQADNDVDVEELPSLEVNLTRIAPLIFLLCAGIILSVVLIILERNKLRFSRNEGSLTRIKPVIPKSENTQWQLQVCN